MWRYIITSSILIGCSIMNHPAPRKAATFEDGLCSNMWTMEEERGPAGVNGKVPWGDEGGRQMGKAMENIIYLLLMNKVVPQFVNSKLVNITPITKVYR